VGNQQCLCMLLHGTISLCRNRAYDFCNVLITSKLGTMPFANDGLMYILCCRSFPDHMQSIRCFTYSSLPFRNTQPIKHDTIANWVCKRVQPSKHGHKCCLEDIPSCCFLPSQGLKGSTVSLRPPVAWATGTVP